ncbi:MAG TPA: histidinol-phosphate transaminase [Cyanothece sp. UBA12306]|nr:histidinol-phosphate transaminase [Cyanothece sp. UBA12306]
MTNLINEQIKVLNSKQAINRGTNSIRLDKGEFPYPPSPKVVQAIATAASEINRYPDVLGGDLREALAKYTGKKINQIIIGNGSDDIIELILKVFVTIGEEVLLPIPTFFVYDFATQVVGGNSIAVPRNKDFSLNTDAIFEKLSDKTKVIFIANPNNPTANLVNRNTILEILERVECLVVIDECYYEFCQETVSDLVEKYPNLIVLRSLSKSFGLAGIRLGYAIANETIIDYLYRAAQLFPVNKLAIIAANAALEEQDYVNSNIQKICQERNQLTLAMENLGLIVYPSATNFLFVSTKNLGITSQNLVQSLKEKNIFVADFGLKQGLDAYHFRTAVGTTRENQILLAGLNEIFDQKQNT